MGVETEYGEKRKLSEKKGKVKPKDRKRKIASDSSAEIASGPAPPVEKKPKASKISTKKPPSTAVTARNENGTVGTGRGSANDTRADSSRLFGTGTVAAADKKIRSRRLKKQADGRKADKFDNLVEKYRNKLAGKGGSWFK